jgi:hypothetical protein
MDKKNNPEKYATQNAILQPQFELPTMQKNAGGGGMNAGLAGLGLTAGAAGGGLGALGLTGAGSTAGPAGNKLAALLGGGESKNAGGDATKASVLGASKSAERGGDSASKYVVNGAEGEQGAANAEETDALMSRAGEDKMAEKAAILAKMGGQQVKKADEIIDKCLDCCVQKCPEKCCRPMHFPWAYEGQPLKLYVNLLLFRVILVFCSLFSQPITFLAFVPPFPPLINPQT